MPWQRDVPPMPLIILLVVAAKYMDMDLRLLFSYLLPPAVLCISLYLVVSAYRRKSSNAKFPPGKTGWPIIGETWDFVRAGRSGTPEKFVNDRMSKYSTDVFHTSLLGDNLAMFCGVSGNKFLFSSENKYVTTWWPRPIQRILSFPEEIVTSSKDDSTILRRFLPEILKPEALKHYIPVMDSMAKDHLEADWSPYKQVRVLPLSKKYTFALACRLFMNIKDPAHVSRLENHFNLVTNGLVSVPINFPGTTYYRAVKGGKIIREELLAIMKQRKGELASENYEERAEATDLLTLMLLASDDNGQPLNERDIAYKVLGLLVAGHDTTSSAITMVMYYLAEYPHIYQRVLEEQKEIAMSKAPGELLNWDDVQKMKYSWSVACEVLRVSPPVSGTFREVIADFSFAGFTIPKGWKAYWSVYSTHKNPKYFPDPEKFDPSRFEGKGPAPYTFVPFGGGPFMCAGKEYARLEILVFMHNLVNRVKWEKVIPNEKIMYTSFAMPVKGLPVLLQPLRN